MAARTREAIAKRALPAALWIAAILLIPAGFSLYDDRPLTWMNWRGYFFIFGLPYALAILYWLFWGTEYYEPGQPEGAPTRERD